MPKNSYYNIILAKAFRFPSAVTEGRFVKLNADEDMVLCGAGEKPDGITLRNCEEGSVNDVLLIGIAPLEIGAAVTMSARVLTPDASGRGVAAGSGDFPGARTLGAGSEAGVFVPVIMDQGNVQLA